jgi:hypothetical protein
MLDYEIRVLSAGHAILIIEVRHLSDQAAVRAAKNLAGDRPFEVWRDLDCIYAPPKPPRDPRQRSSPVA